MRAKSSVSRVLLTTFVNAFRSATAGRGFFLGGISPALAETARSIAYHLADLLRAGGDWREADSMAPSPRGRGLIQG